ncbi:MAG: response regulator [Proteobacteria bacterium]|nr:response regulator [Pseudomonadota bacterium]MBU1743812.1 response regulator [Pseudomonadota bacterium]
MRILLVEDNADHRELMRIALTEYDAAWQVDGVESGDEALRHLAEREAYDVVFLDYSLPGRDGLEALEEIRRGEAPPPVVMVTGRGDEQVAVKAMKGGAYDYVVKGKGYLQRLPVVAHRAVEAHQLAVERKRMEEQLHASLREKELLLSEIHHRVKNNMQVISGLLDLQARSSKNPELMEMFHESQIRIQAMALVHEKLYGSKDFARIDLAGYVRTLSQELFQSYKINPGKMNLIVQADGEVYVDINKAIPCGLILNELISNALQHAFPGDGPGEIKIIIGETKETEIEIVIRDNGVGLPDDVDIHQPRTVGLHLVNGLVKNQIDGQIEVRRDNGTEFRIKFPL